MWPVSDEFLEAIRGTHKIAVQVERADSWMGPWEPITYGVTEGSVRIDRAGDISRTLDLTIVGWESVEDVFDEITPYDTLLRVSRGIEFIDHTELVPLGVFRVYDMSNTANEMKITGYSQEVDLRDRRWVTPYVHSGGSIPLIIQDIVHDALPDNDVTFVLSVWSSIGLSHDLVWERDRLKAIQDLATASGASFGTFPDGTFCVCEPADLSVDSPTWDIDVGENGVLVSYTRTRSRTSVYNGVVVSNEDPMAISDPTSPAPIRILATDDDSTSPTYWDGSFGKVPRFYVSQFITSEAQAITAGVNMLRVSKGINAGLDFEFIPNPALDVNDVVRVIYRNDFAQNHVIDSMEISLGADATVKATSRTDRFDDVSDI